MYFRFNSTFMILDSTTIKKGENTFISLIHQIETFFSVWYMIRAERKSPGVIPFSSTIYRMKIWNDSLILYWVYHVSADRKFITWNFWWRQTILILSFSLFFQNNNNFDQSELFLVLKNWSTEKKTFSVSSEVSNDWIPFSFCVYYLHHDVSWQNFFFQWVTK